MSLIEEFKGVLGPESKATVAEKARFGSARNDDPYSSQFAKTDLSGLTSLNNGSLNFTDFKSSGGLEKGRDQFRAASPRSPVGRKDRADSSSGKRLVENVPPPRHAVSDEVVPQFYFPKGQPVSEESKQQNRKLLDEIFEQKTSLKFSDFDSLCKGAFNIPTIFTRMLWDNIKLIFKLGDKIEEISKAILLDYFVREFEEHSTDRRVFKLLCGPTKDYIAPSDFKPLFRHLLDAHPGLEFLQATPEFQDRYADTVVMRIFFMADSNDDDRITWRDFKLSNLMDTFQHVSNENDINVVRQYFSYEHFYVLYCRFWELDTDHDFLIDKEDFSRYEGHALSRKAVDRIFEQVPRKFKSGKKDKMNYEDFVWFMLSEEDKTTLRSLRYWFKVIDLDDNLIITPHEMEYFYEEQVHRLEYLNHEPILFVDLLC